MAILGKPWNKVKKSFSIHRVTTKNRVFSREFLPSAGISNAATKCKRSEKITKRKM
jgi:hypothetical protein